MATCDAHYLRQEDNYAHDVLLCINTGRLLKDENRMRYGSDQFYVRPPEEMYELFPGQEAAVKRSQEIADKCDLKLDFKKRHFPVFTPPDKKTPEEYLRELCEIGLEERYGTNAGAGSASPHGRRPRNGSNTSSAIICRMGFAGYFLIVWDFVRFAISRRASRPAPAARRAGRSSATCLKLSHVCPLEYDLLFERFLDPNRSEAPDIDIDFCQDRREEVIQYVREKYGEASVAQIGDLRHHGGQGGDQGRRPGPGYSARARQSAHRDGAEGAQHLAGGIAPAKPRPANANTTTTPTSAS